MLCLSKCRLWYLSAILIFIFSLSACNQLKSGSPFKKSSPLIVMDRAWLSESKAAFEKKDPVIRFSVHEIIETANQGLTEGPYSVTNKSITPDSGDKQDYMSIGPYWWPDESKADGLPWIRKDGVVNPESRSPQSDKYGFNKMMISMSSLALASYFTEDDKYAKHGKLLIDTWFNDPDTRMNPNLNYGQAVPGLFAGREFGIIETRWLIRLIDDVTLMAESPAFGKETEAGFKQWIAAYYDWLSTGELGEKACNAHNNHGTYCEAQVAAFALYLGKDDVARQYVKRAQHRLGEQITAKGEQPDELNRTRPFHYSIFNLEAYFILAEIGDQVGVDLWHHTAENGASLRSALDYVADVAENGREGWHGHKIKSKTRVGRLYYFLARGAQAYSSPAYLDKVSPLVDIIAAEDRVEMTQCLAIAPVPPTVTVDVLNKVAASGKRSRSRCYY